MSFFPPDVNETEVSRLTRKLIDGETFLVTTEPQALAEATVLALRYVRNQRDQAYGRNEKLEGELRELRKGA